MNKTKIEGYYNLGEIQDFSQVFKWGKAGNISEVVLVRTSTSGKHTYWTGDLFPLSKKYDNAERAVDLKEVCEALRTTTIEYVSDLKEFLKDHELGIRYAKFAQIEDKRNG